MTDMHKEADQRIIEHSREYMRKAIWSHLNLLLPKELSAVDIDRVTELFLAGGAEALSADWWQPSPPPTVPQEVRAV